MLARLIACLKANVWSILSLLIGGYFLLAFHLHVGFPPTAPLAPTAATYLGLFAFFVVLPFAQRLKVGKLIEFEAKMNEVRAEVKADVKEMRTETRELISTTVSAVANTITASVKNQNVFMFPPPQGWETTSTEPPEPIEREREILEYLEAGGSDVNYALARLRMDLEQELRRILDEPLPVFGDQLRRQERRTFLSARPLFQRLGSRNSRYKDMQRSFDYLVEVCNAAIHGQLIPQPFAYEAIDMGLRILRELKQETTLPQ